MKKVFIFISMVFVATLFGCAQTTEPTVNKDAAVITFEEIEHDYGTIENGSNGVYEFKFKNTGKEPLIVNNVQTSCGCTVPDWTRDPVAKGKSGVVKVSYNTANTGTFNKTATVYSNANNSPLVLRIKGTVNPKPLVPQETQAQPTK